MIPVPIPPHVPLTLAREVRIARALGECTESIARALGETLTSLIVPVQCLACVSRRRRGEGFTCRWCAAPGRSPLMFMWAGPPPPLDAEEFKPVAEPVSTFGRSDVPPPVELPADHVPMCTPYGIPVAG